MYSLGVVLYELLSGVLPFDLRKVAYDELLRRLREEDAPKPSTQIRAGGEDSAIAARNRGGDPPAVARQLRGEPDAIALKALERDRAHRYASASELASDIERYLRNEPVTAHAASAAYRTRKYLRRHRVGATVAAALVLLLFAFAIAQAVELRHVARERDRATRERDRADRITQFMTGMFKVSNPSEARGNTVTAREILDKASREIDTGLAHDPALQAQMMHTMASTYSGLGLYQQTESLQERALEIRRRVLGPRHPETLRLKSDLAVDLSLEGRYADAERMMRETLKTQREVLGSEHRDTLHSMGVLGNILDAEAKYPEALALKQSALDVERRTLGLEDRETPFTMSELADTLGDMGRYGEAETVEREALDAQRRILGPEHPTTLVTMSDLAGILANERKYAEAEKMHREVLEKTRRLLGPEHPNTAWSTSQLADDLEKEGRHVEAEKLAREALGMEQRVNGPESPGAMYSESRLANVLAAEGHYQDAERLYWRLIRTATKTNAGAQLGLSWYDLASMSAKAGLHDKALEYLGHAVDSGFGRPEWIAGDPDLKSIHGDPRFNALIAKARQTAAK